MRAVPVRLLKNAGGNVVDQAVSALSNVALSIAVARSVDASGFGAFSVAFLIFGIAVAVTRSLAGQPLQIRFSAAQDAEAVLACRQALGGALLLGIAGSLACLAFGLVSAGRTGAALMALAVILPALLVQDTARMAFFARGRAWSAALIDTVWAVVSLSLLVGLILTGRSSVTLLIGAWGAGAAVAAALGIALLASPPLPVAGARWLTRQRSLSRYLLAEYVLGLGSMQVGILLVGLVAGVGAVGSLRAAQVLLGPLGILGAAAFQFAVPEVARRPQAGRRLLATFGGVVSAALGAATAAYLVLLLLIPPRMGRAMFGDTWDGAAVVLLAMGLSSLFSALANGPASVLYGLGHARKTFRINIVKGPLLIAGLLTSTWLAGTVGAAWALALIEVVMLPAWVLTLVSSLRSRGVVEQPPGHDQSKAGPHDPASTAEVAHG